MGTTEEKTLDRTMNKPRKIWIACLLSLICPGLGQIYNGQARKGVLFLVLPLAFFPLEVLVLNSDRLLCYLAIFSLLLAACYLTVVVDAIMTARRLGSFYSPRRYNKIIVYAGVAVLSCAVSNSLSAYVKHNFVQAYKVTASSMEPALLAGDHILVDRQQKGRMPKRGDIIVFQHPGDPARDFIKRVVAVGGDTVEVRKGQLVLNGKTINEPYVARAAGRYVHHEEPFPDNPGPLTIPTDSYFVLGDLRDNSLDSRHFGPVGREKVKGKATGIYFSWDRNASSVRWGRIGKKIQ
jgi:signal peptidase I